MWIRIALLYITKTEMYDKNIIHYFIIWIKWIRLDIIGKYGRVLLDYINKEWNCIKGFVNILKKELHDKRIEIINVTNQKSYLEKLKN